MRTAQRSTKTPPTLPQILDAGASTLARQVSRPTYVMRLRSHVSSRMDEFTARRADSSNSWRLLNTGAIIQVALARSWLPAYFQFGSYSG